MDLKGQQDSLRRFRLDIVLGRVPDTNVLDRTKLWRSLRLPISPGIEKAKLLSGSKICSVGRNFLVGNE